VCIGAQKEFAKGRQGLGFMTTFAGRAFQDPALRDFRNSNSGTLGADGWIFLDSAKTWSTTAWVAGSRIAGSPARLTAVQTILCTISSALTRRACGSIRTATTLTGTAARFTACQKAWQHLREFPRSASSHPALRCE